jgi:hypothetical protein
MENQLPDTLNWVKKAFERTIQFTNGANEIIGFIQFEPFNSRVTANLNDLTVHYDIQGFINKEVRISNGQDEELGQIKLGFTSKAEIVLTNGEIYVWKREDFFQKEWTLIHDLPNTDNDPVSVSYNRTREFFAEKGSIKLEESSANEPLLVLTGFFIGYYFLRRKRKMAAALIAVNVIG